MNDAYHAYYGHGERPSINGGFRPSINSDPYGHVHPANGAIQDSRTLSGLDLNCS